VGLAAQLLGRLEAGSMRDPGWSGVASLGALGAVSLLAGAPAQPWWALALAVGAGCGLGLAILALVRRCWPRQAGRVHVLGVAVALTAPALAFALLIGDVRIATWVRWSLGSLEQRDWTTWQQVWPVAGLALLAVLAHMAWPQRHPVLWVAAGLAVAGATLAAGALGLVGLLAGRLAERTSSGTSGRYTLAAVNGAALLLGADLAARGLSAVLPSLGLISELPVGALLVAASGLTAVGSFWKRHGKN
jgi:iron complex transport system permease protein